MNFYTIKSTKVTEFQIDVPKYFKILDFHYMILNDSDVLVVNPNYIPDLFIYAYIKIDLSKWHADFWAENQIEPLNEYEFRQVYTDATLEIEKLMN
jgi:hypothetical protein